MITTDVVVIDSGFGSDKLKVQQANLKGINLFYDGKTTQSDENIVDNYGHGTAITNIIRSNCEAEIYILKIFSDGTEINEDLLICALRFVCDNIICKFVNLSMGIKVCERKGELKKICDALQSKGVIIIAAFDNDGCMSYPAAYDSVIGVGNSYKCRRKSHFEYVEGSPVNILAKGGIQRVMWNNHEVVMGGSSFACAYMTAYIAHAFEGQCPSWEQVHNLLRSDSIGVHNCKKHEHNKKDFFEIKKAALFPINKEMHSLIREMENVNFSITGFYDIKQSGRVGAGVNKIVDICRSRDFIIQDICDINFEAIDTLIIGHLSEINRMVGEDIRWKLIEEACKNNVNIFSFDPLDIYDNMMKGWKNKIYYPSITMEDVPQNRFGRLYVIDKPVVAVMGTSSKQGKFTLQLTLRDLLKKYTYKVGMIGTEPHSLLFDMDFVYPTGYNALLQIDGHSSILLLNSMLNQLCEEDVDIIITGSQSNTIPMNNFNLSAYPMKQHSFLVGIQPDIAMLCISPQDDLQYIINTIKYIEGATNCDVICTVLFPMTETNDWKNTFGIKTKMTTQQIQSFKKSMQSRLGLPVFVLGDPADMTMLAELVVERLSE